jgi:hypothetical protein
MSATNLQNFSGDVQIRGTTFIKANTNTNNLAIGTDAGTTVQGSQTVAVGNQAGNTSQSLRGVAVGAYSGNSEQGQYAVAMGWTAGMTSQGLRAVAVGHAGGNSEQGAYAVAVGYQAGHTSQGANAVAVGNDAGKTEQGQYSTALGVLAGHASQGENAVAVGREAGKTSQGDATVAIGSSAGLTSQGASAIAVGNQAGVTAQGANSIILNATGSAFNATTASSFNVKPVRGGNYAASALAYTSTGEIVEETNMHFDTSGNVGIGTTAPESLLHLSASTASADITDPIKLKIHNRRGAGDWSITQPWGLLEFDTDDTGTAGSGPVAGIGCRMEGAAGGDSSICFYTDAVVNNDNVLGAANERMCINSDGKVGIGTTAPGAQLQVKASGTGNPNVNGVYVFNPTSGSGDAIITARVNGAGGDPYLSFDVNGVSGWAFGIDSSDSGKLKWGTNWDSLTAGTKMTLDTSGNLGIGVSDPTYKLDVLNAIRIRGNYPTINFSEGTGASTQPAFRIFNDGAGMNDNNNYLAIQRNTSGTTYESVIHCNLAGVVNIPGGLTGGFTLADARIPSLAASKITSGSFADARIPSLAASKITSGSFADARIPNLNTSKLTAGTLSTSRGGTGTTSVTGSGSLVKSGSPTFVTKMSSPIVVASSKLGVGVTSPTCLLELTNSIANRKIGLFAGTGVNPTDHYGFGINSSTLRYNVDSTSSVHRFYGGSTPFGYINNTPGFNNSFTGQHKSFPHESLSGKTLDELSGLIVCASGEHISVNDAIPQRGQDGITVSEAIPSVKLSVTENEKTVFGVVSNVEDPESTEREDRSGAFTSTFIKLVGDTRIYVNSIGEGAVWVVNTNGSFVNGDYITTSNVAGYGQKQASESLKNYTVAKITMDCDFVGTTAPKKRIKKKTVTETLEETVEETFEDNMPEDVYTYDVDRECYVKTVKDDIKTKTRSVMQEYELRDSDGNVITEPAPNTITIEQYEALENKEGCVANNDENTGIIQNYTQTINKPVVYSGNKIVVNTVTHEVDDLDEHGQLQWEDHPTETEKAYKIRYLDANGVITDEANIVHTAAFVGCTYHCG